MSSASSVAWILPLQRHRRNFLSAQAPMRAQEAKEFWQPRQPTKEVCALRSRASFEENSSVVPLRRTGGSCRAAGRSGPEAPASVRQSPHNNGGATFCVPLQGQNPNGQRQSEPLSREVTPTGSRGNGPVISNANSFNGVFLLLLLNVAAFVADHVLKLPAMRWLYLHHSSARWYQFVTSTFCHASWNHLSSNLFFLYIFGRLVEEEEGSVGLWATYLITGAGANIVSWLVLPRTVMSVGASGAVFGLFAVSVLTRLRFNWRKVLEVVILGQFVIERLIVEARSSAMITIGRDAVAVTTGVNHVAHLAGALVGVLLMWLVTKIPETSPKTHRPAS